MDDAILETKVVDFALGDRAASAKFVRYQNGWVIDTISEDGYPDQGDSDSVFPTIELAIKEVQRMWPW